MCCKELIKKTGGDKACFDNKTTAKENNKIFSIDYPKGETFCRIHIDDCLIKSDKVEKCDYVFVRCKNKDVYYVELKGLKIDKAYSQIVETLKTHFPSPKENNYGFIVATKVVPRQTQKNRKLKDDFAKKYGVKLRIESQKCIHKVV